jgi:hypothetical protein
MELAKPLRRLLVLFVMGTLLARGKRSLAELGRTVARLQRYRGQVSRATRNDDFKTRDLYIQAYADAVRRLGEEDIAPTRRRLWAVALDDVSTERGGFTKIENGLHKRKARKNPGKKQGRPPSKSHTFITGLLIKENGVRIPLPRMTWRTRKYAKKLGKKYESKVALAAKMLRALKPLLPENVDIVVVADGLYDAAPFMEACRKLHFKLIAPVDSRRCFGDVASGAKDSKRILHARGRSLPRSAFQRVVLVRGKEETASYRRYTPDEEERDDTRTFRVCHEARDVAGLGLVGVVYSWKSPVYRPRRSEKRESFKVLVCSDSDMPAARVVELYDLRWQVELFFREIKGGLGLGNYTGTDFHAYERLVDLTLLSFLCLEELRQHGIEAASAPVRRAKLASSRTAELKRELEREAMANDVAWLTTSLETKRGRRRLRAILERLRSAA